MKVWKLSAELEEQVREVWRKQGSIIDEAPPLIKELTSIEPKGVDIHGSFRFSAKDENVTLPDHLNVDSNGVITLDGRYNKSKEIKAEWDEKMGGYKNMGVLMEVFAPYMYTGRSATIRFDYEEGEEGVYVVDNKNIDLEGAGCTEHEVKIKPSNTSEEFI